MMQTPFYVVVGLGKTGLSIARYLRRRGHAFAVFDTRSNPPHLAAFHAEFPNVDVFFSDFPTALYAQLTAMIMSPGVSLHEPFVQTAQKMGIPIWGDIECFSHAVNAPVIAITGTNGKSTVTRLVGEMAKAAGFTVAVAGNIGEPVLDALDDGTPYDLWVLELSSFQLELTYSLKPIAGTILNITPDHLDRHITLQAYRNAKQRIYHQTLYLLHNRDDSQTAPSAEKHGEIQCVASFGLNQPQSGEWGIVSDGTNHYLAYGAVPFMSVEALRIKGRHNWQNALAACGLAHAVGVPMASMIQTLQRFAGLAHRSQWVRTIHGIDWVNDSKGTNVGATVSAITGIAPSISGKIVLIAGGLGKGADFTALRTPIMAHVRSVVLIGKDADSIEESLIGAVPIRRATSLEEAVVMAKTAAQSGDTVLLSPACASQDMFDDFNHRGEVFRTVVMGL